MTAAKKLLIGLVLAVGLAVIAVGFLPASRLRLRLTIDSGQPYHISALAISDDDELLAAGSPGGAKVWELAGGQERHSFDGTSLSVSFSTDRKLLATGGEFGGGVRVWNLASGEKRATFKGHNGGVLCVAMSAMGDVLASAGYDETIRIWDVGKESERMRLAWLRKRLPSSVAWSLAVSPDARSLASGHYDGTVRIWDMATGRETATFEGHNDWVVALTFLGNDQLLSASHDTTIRLWELSSGREKRVFKGHTAGVLGAAVSTDGQSMVSADKDATVRFWDMATGNEQAIVKISAAPLSSVAFSRSLTLLATGSDQGKIRVWKISK